MDFNMENKVVIVTGGSSGLGKAIAGAFHDEGAIVVVNGRNQSKIEEAVAGIGSRAHGIVADLTKIEDCEKLYSFASEFGPVEYLVNNIGIFESVDFFEIKDERWFEFFDVNVMTGVRISRIALRDMLKRNSGSIVFISSDAAVKSIGWMAHYSMSKSAQLGVSRALAELTKGTNVRVNTLMPGPSATDSVRTYFQEMADQKQSTVEDVLKNYFIESEPSSLLQHLIDPKDLGRAVVSLATNPIANGSAQRCEGGVIRSAF